MWGGVRGNFGARIVRRSAFQGRTHILVSKLQQVDEPTGALREPDGAAARLGWRVAIEQTVAGLGYELVEMVRGQRGLLQVFIDREPGRVYPTGESEFVTVDDCEVVTRQLQFVLEVETVAYERLEVSSPGLDRPLKRAADFERFVGSEVAITLKVPFQGRKVFKGVLGHGDLASAEATAADTWSLVLQEGSDKPEKPKAAKSAKHTQRAAAVEVNQVKQVLAFNLDEVREARLVPMVDFKGRRGKTAAVEPTGADGGQDR